MTPAETQTLLTAIVDDLNVVASIAAGVDPALIPFLAIGRAVDKQIPGLVASVQAWIDGNLPTPQEISDHAAKLAVLSDPNQP